MGEDWKWSVHGQTGALAHGPHITDVTTISATET